MFSMFSDFIRALNSLDNADYYNRNAERFYAMYRNSDDNGWGFSDEMSIIYSEIQWRAEEE